MNIETNKIRRAYKGKEGECCCGCSGRYYYAYQGKNAKRQIARIAEAMRQIEAEGGEIEENGPGSYTAENGSTRYIITY